jgi:hypothetical protein
VILDLVGLKVIVDPASKVNGARVAAVTVIVVYSGSMEVVQDGTTLGAGDGDAVALLCSAPLIKATFVEGVSAGVVGHCLIVSQISEHADLAVRVTFVGAVTQHTKRIIVIPRLGG